MSSKKSIVEIIEENKKTLLAEYQKGYLAGFKEAEKRSIEEFLEDLKTMILEPDKWWIKLDLRDKWKKRLKQ